MAFRRKLLKSGAGKSREEIDLAQGKITDSRKYSVLSFNHGILAGKTMEKADYGIRKYLSSLISCMFCGEAEQWLFSTQSKD